jgi:hypothetical protein
VQLLRPEGFYRAIDEINLDDEVVGWLPCRANEIEASHSIWICFRLESNERKLALFLPIHPFF